MTDAVVVGAAAVARLRAALARERTLFEPRREHGESDWRRATGAEPFDAEAPPPLAGVKRFFFPPRETLLGWRGDEVSEALPAPAPFVLFGVAPCDVAATAALDAFFAADPWWVRRRARALLVARNCRVACATGFCRDVGAGPFAPRGFDLCWTPLGDGRVVLEAATPAGREALAAAAIAGAPLDADGRRRLAAAADAAAASFPARPWIATALARMENPPAVADAEWAALAPACLACTGCTSVCPTCSCFTVVDEPRPGGGARVREWDSCLLEGFQREASGHHPAPRPADRVRRYWEHKLSPAFVAALGRLGCVGCGRCEVACPGTIGALTVLRALGRP